MEGPSTGRSVSISGQGVLNPDLVSRRQGKGVERVSEVEEEANAEVRGERRYGFLCLECSPVCRPVSESSIRDTGCR